METAMKFEGCKLSFQLIPQSPHIHFQHDEQRPTLRGSELKPKLDRFLCAKMKMEQPMALDYKVKIICEETKNSDVVTVGQLASKKKNLPEEYSLFFGNIGKEPAEQIKGVWSFPKVTIICFNEEVKKCIEENIVEFFFVTNFGMMQGKGFGSYVIQGTEIKHDKEEKDLKLVIKWLMENNHTTLVWSCECLKTLQTQNEIGNALFGWIKRFYGIMKSGQNFVEYERSFLFKYMHKSGGKAVDSSNVLKNIDNEKAWMKQNKIAPIYFKPENEKKHDLKDENSKYVRAFLGLSGPQTWQSENGKKTITITDPKKEIERFQSPIFFKVYGRHICFIAKPIPYELYDHEFEFKGDKTGRLSTPAKSEFTGNEFDIAKFVSEYVKYYNNNKKLQNKEFKQIEEWGVDGENIYRNNNRTDCGNNL